MRLGPSFVLALGVVAACSSGGNNGGPNAGPSPIPGFDTSVRRLIDGSGKEGPVTARWILLSRPGPGFVSFRAEICIDAIPNPSNNVYLSQMRIWIMGSADGIHPNGETSVDREGGELWRVHNGSCTTIKRVPVANGGTDGSQFLFVDPSARYVVVTAWFGETLSVINPSEWPGPACPPYETIGRSAFTIRCMNYIATPLQ